MSWDFNMFLSNEQPYLPYLLYSYASILVPRPKSAAQAHKTILAKSSCMWSLPPRSAQRTASVVRSHRWKTGNSLSLGLYLGQTGSTMYWVTRSTYVISCRRDLLCVRWSLLLAEFFKDDLSRNHGVVVYCPASPNKIESHWFSGLFFAEHNKSKGSNSFKCLDHKLIL